MFSSDETRLICVIGILGKAVLWSLYQKPEDLHCSHTLSIPEKGEYDLSHTNCLDL